jgi:phosphoesterase RecJ-like protein
VTDWNSPAPPLVDWNPFDELVENHRRFVLTTHINPDGDGLGSEAALGLYLQGLGKDVTILNDGELPFNFQFLGRSISYVTFEAERAREILSSAEVLVILDTLVLSRIGKVEPLVRGSNLKIAVIDHHLGNADFADVAVVEKEACSTGELVYDYIRRNPGAWTRPMAEGAYAALITDTGSFRFSNTDPAAHAMAGHLVSLGVEPEKIGVEVFRYRHPDRVRFMGNVLANMHLNRDGTVAWLEVTRDLMDRFQVNGQDTEGLVDFPRTVPGVEVVALFTETGNGRVKLSMRSGGLVDVQNLATRFGGGGHRVAAGAQLEGPLEEARDKVIGTLEEAVGAARDAAQTASSRKGENGSD